MSRISRGKANSLRTAPSGRRSKPHAAVIPDSPSPLAVKPALLDRMTALLDRFERHSNAASLIYLALILAFALPPLLAGLSRAWFYTADELMIAGESIRFADLDPRQHFFDLPGTPFMMLTAVLWAALRQIAQWFAPDPWYGGIDSSMSGIVEFTYRHLDWLFTLIRSETIFFWACSLVLLYLLSRKLLNHAGACVACLVLMMSPAFSLFSSFCRVESMAVAFTLAALLVAYRALEKGGRQLGARPSWRDSLIWAGALAGVAAAARLHSIAASGMVLFLVLLCDERTPRRDRYPGWVRSAAWFAVPLIGIGGAVCFWLAKWQWSGEFPHAGAVLAKAAAGLAIAPFVLVLLYRLPGIRPILIRAAGPETIKVGIGIVCGFLLANPMLIPRFRYFLGSVEMYSAGYRDWTRATWPLWKNIRWYVALYARNFAPDTVLLLLLLGGAILAVASRNRRLWPFLLTFVGFFVSKPLNMIAAPHHTLLWLPFFALLCGYPVARLYDFVRTRDAGGAKWRLAACGAAAVVYLAIALSLSNGPAMAASQVQGDRARLANIEKASHWILSNTRPDSTVAISNPCFNPDIFYIWLQALDVPVPPSVFDRRHYVIWFGNRGTVSGLAGYACTAGPIGTPENWDNLALTDPNHISDPNREPGFQRVAAFGNDFNEVDIFRFDFRGDPVRRK